MNYMLLKNTLTVLLVLAAGNAVAQTAGWQTANSSIYASTPDIRFDDLCFFNRDTGITVSGDGKIFKTTDGENWALKYNNSDNYLRCVEFNEDHRIGIVGSVSGVILRTTDGGESWLDISAAVPKTITDTNRICGLAHVGNTFYGVGWWGGTQASFYKSTDTGTSWIVSAIDSNVASGLVEIQPGPGNTLLASGFHNMDGGKRESVIIKSSDGGNSWSKVFADTVIGGRVWKIQVLKPSLMYACIEPLYKDSVTILRSTDGGNSWQIIPVAHRSQDAQTVGFIDSLHGWVGGHFSGMYETVDGGASWQQIAPGYALNRFIRVDSSLMYASGRTVYKYDHAVNVSVPGNIKPVTSAHKLYPVTPNPVSHTALVEFDITLSTNVLLEVIGTDSRVIYRIAGAYFKPGHYKYQWNGSNMPAGNYIVWLGTDEAPQVQKFTLTH